MYQVLKGFTLCIRYFLGNFTALLVYQIHPRMKVAAIQKRPLYRLLACNSPSNCILNFLPVFVKFSQQSLIAFANLYIATFFCSLLSSFKRRKLFRISMRSSFWRSVRDSSSTSLSQKDSGTPKIAEKERIVSSVGSCKCSHTAKPCSRNDLFFWRIPFATVRALRATLSELRQNLSSLLSPLVTILRS